MQQRNNTISYYANNDSVSNALDAWTTGVATGGGVGGVVGDGGTDGVATRGAGGTVSGGGVAVEDGGSRSGKGVDDYVKSVLEEYKDNDLSVRNGHLDTTHATKASHCHLDNALTTTTNLATTTDATGAISVLKAACDSSVDLIDIA